MEIGREEKLKSITAGILPENVGMQAVCKKLKFKLKHSATEGMVRAEIEL